MMLITILLMIEDRCNTSFAQNTCYVHKKLYHLLYVMKTGVKQNRYFTLRWVYTSDAVKRRTRSHTMRRFAALAGAFRLASVCASVVLKSINARAYKAWQQLSDFPDTIKYV